MEFKILFFVIICYLIGSIPFAYLLTKLLGLGDIRKIGSGNVGSTNVLRTGNKFLAIVVLLLDIAKGFFPLFILKNFSIINSEMLIYMISSLCIIGHIFPVWLKFKGGKGVATYIGFLLSTDYILGLIFILCWMIIATITRYSSLSSILSLLIIPCIILLFYPLKISLDYLFLFISIIIIIKHYSNILRLLNKTENKIRF